MPKVYRRRERIMAYVYIWSKECEVWTVGFYKPDGTFEPESDHELPDEAARRVAWLNGGAPEKGENE